MSELFRLYEDFYAGEENQSKLIEDTKRFVRRFYNVVNLQNHAAYFSDISDNRSSYGFILCPENESGLPAINLTDVASVSRPIALLTLKLYQILNLPKTSRVLFNVQMYKGDSKPVAKHFDGEFLEFSVDGEELNIKRAIRPQQVAVLTLLNNTLEGGTRVHYDTTEGASESSVIKGKAGDLLVFDNIKCHHSVDKLESNGHKRLDGLVRMIIGWRSIESNCELYDNGKFIAADAEIVRQVHAEWLKNEWPKMFEDYVTQTQQVAF
jgi:hypothetical protein